VSEASSFLIFLGLCLFLSGAVFFGVSFYYWRRWRGEIKIFSASLRRVLEGAPPGPLPGGPVLRPLVETLAGYLESQRKRLFVCEEERARFSKILEGLREGLIILDQDEKIVFANAAAGKILGLPLRTGHSVREVLRDEAALQAMKDGSPDPVEIELFWPMPRVVSLRAVPLPQGMCALLLEDVTPVKKLSQVRRDFVANLTHEIRTPLTAIAGYAENLLAEDLEDKDLVREQLGIILRHARRLGKLIQDLLLLSTLETRGIPQKEKEPLSLEEVLSAALEAVGPQARQKSLEIRFRGEAPSLSLTCGSYDLLVQALTNILDNAVKFSPEKGEVTISLREEGDFWVIEVQDQGPGLPSSERERIFERFYRGKRGQARGTGLGLAIVKHIVLAHGGRIEAESEPGAGACFRIFLPKASS